MTERLCDELEPDIVSFFLLAPYPINEYYDPETMNEWDWSMFDEYGNDWVHTETLSNQALKDIQKRLVEKYQDVIALVAPHHEHAKLTCICADIFNWKPPKNTKYDTIYFDIWNNVCTDNLPEIATLHQRFKYYKAKNGWMGSWNLHSKCRSYGHN